MARGGKAGVEVEGARELRRAMRRMEADMGDLTDVNRAAAAIVSEAAGDLVPVLTGALHDSIRTTAARTRSAVVAGRGSVPYAGPIHFGWPARGIEPQPFLYEALDDRRDQVAAAYADRVGDLVRRLDREAP